MDANKSQFLIMQTLFKMYRYRHRPFTSFQQWSDPEPPRWRKFAECAEERDWDAFGSTAGRKRPDINIEIFFVSANNQRLRQTTPPGWEAYLRWRLLHAAKIPFEYMYEAGTPGSKLQAKDIPAGYTSVSVPISILGYI